MVMTRFLFVFMAWCWEGNRETRAEIQCVPLFFHQLTRLWICRTQGFSKTSMPKEWCSSLWPAAGECDQTAPFFFHVRIMVSHSIICMKWPGESSSILQCLSISTSSVYSVLHLALIRDGFNRTGSGTAQEVSLLDSIVWVTMGLLWACHKGGIVWTSFLIFP